MSTQLENRESHKEVQQKESQHGSHAAQEAIEAYKPQAKTEKHQAKEEPTQLSFNDTNIYKTDDKAQSQVKDTAQDKAEVQAKDTAQDKAQGQAKDTAQDKAEGQAKDTAQDKAEGQAKDTAQDKAESGEKHYQIKGGDNLTHIAKEQLGKDASEQEIQKYIKEIAKRNDIKDINLIYEDKWLDLPEVHKNTEKAPPGDTPKEGKQDQTRPVADAQQATTDAGKGEQTPSPGDNQLHNGTGDKQPAAKDTQTQDGTGDKQPAAKDTQPQDGSGDKQPAGGEPPADRPPPPQETQEKIAPTDKVEGNSDSKIESPELTKEREHLSNLAQDKMNSVEYDKFSKQMNKLEERSSKLEEQYEKQGIPQAEAQEKAQEEIAKTYHEVSRVLEAKDNPDVPIDSKERTRIAAEIVSNAADPTSIRQGAHKTCNVTTVETRTYTREPSTAAKLVADMTTTGSYTGGDGTKVSLDKQSMRPDEDALKKDSEHNRNFASQLFQVTAVNMHYAKSGSDIRYEQHKIDNTLTPPDSGERLVDYSKNPPQDITASLLEKLLTDNTDATYHRPGLSDKEIAEISNSITGKNEKDVLLDREDDTDQTQSIKSAKELEDTLLNAKESGRLPLIIVVHTGNEPFYTDSGEGSAGGSGGWHAITVTDIEPGSPPKISIDNQWDKSADHTAGDRLSAKDLYAAMKTPCHPETIKDLQEEVKHNREAGKIDDVKELELLRMQHTIGALNDEQYNKAFLSHMKESQERWHDIMSHGTNDLELMERIDKGKQKQTELFLKLPPDKRVEALKIENEVGYQSPYNLDNLFAYNLTQTRKDYEKEESDPAKPMTEERKKLYQKAVHDMVTLMDSLPPERQENIRQYAWGFSVADRAERQRKAKASSETKDSG